MKQSLVILGNNISLIKVIGVEQGFVEDLLGLVHEVGSVELESVADFAQEVEHIGIGQSLVGCDFLVV